MQDQALRIVLTAAGAMLGTLVLAIPVRTISIRYRILDKPGARSSHEVPTARTGGIAILLGIFIGLIYTSGLGYPEEMSAYFEVACLAALVVAGISFIDDLYTIPSLPRLGIHFLMAGVLIWWGKMQLTELELPFVSFGLPPIAGMFFSILFVTGFINFFNFMDGINGIAAFQGIAGGAALAALLLIGGTHNTVLISTALAGACLGFLPHNFPKAKMFMGDIGSTVIGFALAMLTLIGSERTELPWIAFVLPLGVFIYDATFTLFKRMAHGEKFWKPHREHHYQLLIRCGWSHARVSLIQFALMLVCVACAIGYAKGTDPLRLGILAGLLSMFIVYSVLVYRYFKTHRLDLPAPADATIQEPAK